MAIAGVLLPQSHGGQHRERPAPVALPVFSCGTPPAPDRDFEHPYDPLVPALTAAWTRMTREDRSWPLQPSQPHVKPSRGPG